MFNETRQVVQYNEKITGMQALKRNAELGSLNLY